jgi:hypothetical protein
MSYLVQRTGYKVITKKGKEFFVARHKAVITQWIDSKGTQCSTLLHRCHVYKFNNKLNAFVF